MSYKDLGGRQGVVIDTMVFIYLFEDDPNYAELCEHIMHLIGDGTFSGVVTPITAGELLVKPLKQLQFPIADRYRSALRQIPNLTLAWIDFETGYIAGSLRARYGLPLPDMLQAATALTYPARAMITNDRNLQRVQEIDIILLDEIGY